MDVGRLAGTPGGVGAGPSASGPASRSQADRFGGGANGRDGFAAVLWMRGDEPPAGAVLEQVRGLGFDAVQHGAGGRPDAHGLRVYGEQLVPKGLLELRDDDWRPVLERYERDRDVAALVRPACLSEPATRGAVAAAVARGAAALAPAAPLWIALGDEVSATRHCNPLDLCFGPACLTGLRASLLARYGDLETLNAAWGTRFASAEDVRPFSADHVRARELVTGELPLDLRPWADHLDFRDRLFGAVLREALAVAREQAPGIPVGLTGIQPPSAYGGHDYSSFLPHLTFYEAYDIGGARDLAMSLAPAGARQITTLFPPPAHASPRVATARLCDALAHGMSGVVVWSSAEVLADGAPTAFGRAIAAGLQRLRRAAGTFAGAVVERSPIWLVESQPSVRLHWMLDSRHDGRTWIRRLSSYEREHSTSLSARRSWVRLLEDLGYQGRFVAAAELEPRLRGPGRPRVLVLPAVVALSDSAVAAVQEFARRGGTVVADHGTALYDERLVRRREAALDHLFGIRGRRFDLAAYLVAEGRPAAAARLPSGAAAAERGVRSEVADVSGEFAVQIENAAGRGRAVYLNLAVCEYAAVRLDPARVAAARDLRARVRRVLEAAGVLPPVDVRGAGLPTCIERISLRSRTGEELLAVRLNVLDDPALCETLGARGPRPVTVAFAGEVALRDALDGRLLGRGDRHELMLDPWGALLLIVERGR